MIQTNQLVLNWHLTEACNYRCQYCYSTWSKPDCKRELFHDDKHGEDLLQELFRLFHPENKSNPLLARLRWQSVRLNLAGGEPLLYPQKLLAIVAMARTIGFEVSIITNGARLNQDLLSQLAPQLCWLGLSIDSACPKTNHIIGRNDNQGRALDLEILGGALRLAREGHPGMKLKVNTVVNLANHAEDFTPLLTAFAPDKWKVLRMLPVVNNHLSVSDAQYQGFVDRHARWSHLLCAEDNQEMRVSYLMIDPGGRFFQNSANLRVQGYTYSQPIHEVGAAAAFAQMKFDAARFAARYIPLRIAEAV